MSPRPMGKAPDLKRQTGRVASRLTVRRSWLWTFLACCLLAVVGGPAIDLPQAQAAAAGIARSAQGPASLGQAIIFDQPQDTTVGQQVTLTASSVTTTSPPAGTGLTVSFRSDTPAMCTVSGSIVTPMAPGFCVITALQGGDGTYGAATDVARAFRARAGSAPQTITFDQPAATAVGQPVALSGSSVTTTSPPAQTGLTVSFRSDTPGVCTVSGSTVTPTTAGVCTITASQGGNDRYAAAQPVQRSFQAHTGTSQQTITFDLPPYATLGQSVTLSASTDADEPLAVSFRSDSPLVCTVSDSTVTTVAAGACTITAFQGGSATYAPAHASRSFKVIVKTHRYPQQILFGPVPGATVGVPVVLTALSSTVVVEGQNSPTGLTVSYSSQNRQVCTVSGATVVPWASGRCEITASQEGNAQYLPAKPVTQVFPVAPASQTISFTPPASAIIGQPVTLTATASSWLPVAYVSSTQDVCTVSDATVTATAAGTCTITASQPGDNRYAPAPDLTRSFQIDRATQTITFPQPPEVAFGQPVTLTASASSGLAVSYRTDTPDVCTVSGHTATTTTAGTCTITASQPGDNRYAPARDVTRSFAVHARPGQVNTKHHKKVSQEIIFGKPPAADVGEVDPLSASTTSGLAVSFRSDTPLVCTVSGTTVTALTAGTCVITASQAGSARYLAARDVQRSFAVHASGAPVNNGNTQLSPPPPPPPAEHRAQTIAFPQPPEAKVGKPVTLSASATSGLAVAFRSDTPRICTVSGSSVTPIAAGTCTVTASQGGSDGYAAARDVEQSFIVTPATSILPGALTIVLGAVVFAAAGATALVRRLRRRSRRPLGHQPSVRAAPVPGPPALVSVQDTGAGVTHTVRIESSPGASIATIKEARP